MLTRLVLITQVDIPTAIGVGPGSVVAMETDKDPTPTTEKKYYIDPTFLYPPREGVEMVSPLKDGLSRLRDHRLTASSPGLPIAQFFNHLPNGVGRLGRSGHVNDVDYLLR